MVAREFRNAEVGHLRSYPDDPAIRRESMKAHKTENRQYQRQVDQAKQIMNPGGRQSGAGALPRAFGSGRLGGIDFSSLELRYVSDTPGAGGRDLGYAFRAPSSATPGDPAAGLATAQQSSDAFFTWLALPPQTFWVNLNPSQPDRIIDPQLARTDAGRVLLEADMQLKRTISSYTNPSTPIGDQFWDELERIYGDRAPEACISSRNWITPDPATVREDADQLFILDAPLTVKMESELITDPQVGSPSCPQESQAIEDAKEELFRRVILPPVIQQINTSPEYASLRRVYLARVAAEWFRVRGGEHPTAVSGIVDSGNVDAWVARSPFNPADVFNQMLTSIRNGEWTVVRDVASGGQVYKRTLTYGGVDFSQTPRQNVSRADFKARYPKLAKQARRARFEAEAGQDGTWIGGGGGDRPPVTSSSGAPLDELAVGVAIRGPRAVQPGGQVRYRLRVSNVTPAAVRGVRGLRPAVVRPRVRPREPAAAVARRAQLLADPAHRRHAVGRDRRHRPRAGRRERVAAGHGERVDAAPGRRGPDPAAAHVPRADRRRRRAARAGAASRRCHGLTPASRASSRQRRSPGWAWSRPARRSPASRRRRSPRRAGPAAPRRRGSSPRRTPGRDPAGGGASRGSGR